MHVTPDTHLRYTNETCLPMVTLKICPESRFTANFAVALRPRELCRLRL
jgi:hypothetical protein